MRIIGKTDEGYLLSATEEDVNRLIGEFYLKYTDEKNLTPEQLAFKKAQKLLGMEIPIHEMYTAAREVTRDWEEKREIKDTAKYLREMADTLELIAKIYGKQRRGKAV